MSVQAPPGEVKLASTIATRRRRPRFPWVRLTFILPAVVYIILFFGYPLVYSIETSLQNVSIQSMIEGNSPFVGISNYITVLTNQVTQLAATNTFWFTVGSIIPQFCIGLLLAVFFNRRFPLSRTLRSLILLPWLLPFVVTGTVWNWILNQTNGILDQLLFGLHLIGHPIGWLDTPGVSLISVIVVNIWVGIPFNMVLLYSGLQSIPGELYEAASIDGANAWQSFIHITMPLLRSVSAIILMLGFIYTLKAFDVIYVLTGGGPANSSDTLATWSYNLSFSQYFFGQGAALGNIMLIISVLFSLIYLRILRKS